MRINLLNTHKKTDISRKVFEMQGIISTQTYPKYVLTFAKYQETFSKHTETLLYTPPKHAKLFSNIWSKCAEMFPNSWMKYKQTLRITERNMRKHNRSVGPIAVLTNRVTFPIFFYSVHAILSIWLSPCILFSTAYPSTSLLIEL